MKTTRTVMTTVGEVFRPNCSNEDGVIVANEVTTSPLDVQQLVPMVEEIQATTGRKPGMVVADAGYLSEQNLKLLRKKRQRCLVAVPPAGHWTPHGKLTVHPLSDVARETQPGIPLL